MIQRSSPPLNKSQKTLLFVVVGAGVILFLRFGGFAVALRLLRWIIPIVVIVYIWKRLTRKR